MRFEERDCKPWIIDMFTELQTNSPVEIKHVEKAVCFLATPRCGSTMFGEALTSTGAVGVCEEWFNLEYMYGWQQVTNLDFTLEEYLKWVIGHSTRNGVFCCKWHIAQVDNMIQNFKFGMDNFRFDHVFFLRRRDKIAQAVSFAKSMLSDQFRHYEKCKDDRLPEFSEIANALKLICNHEEYYKYQLRKPEHFEIWYEDYQNLNPGPFDEVMEIMGLPKQIAYRTRVKKQRTDATKKLRDDFVAYLQGVDN